MIGFPLDSHVTFETDGTPIWDRAISSAPMRKLIKSMFSDGVLPNPSTNMQVSAGNGMSVVVAAGFATVGGCMKLEETQRTLVTQAASTVYDRIDTVVLRLNDNDSERICDFYIVQGVPATSPVRPTLTRTESIWELGLADLFIAKNSTSISNARITDTRYETARCGVMSSISEFDTTTLYEQVQSDLAGFKSVEQTDFLAWFEEMRNQLSEDAAGNLQNELNSEAIARAAADTALQNAITAETTARTNADTALQNGINAKQNSMMLTSLTNTDLNTIVTGGWYYVTTGCTNLPAGVTEWLLLEVANYGAVVTQKLTRVGTNAIYHRIKDTAGDFAAWKRLDTPLPQDFTTHFIDGQSASGFYTYTATTDCRLLVSVALLKTHNSASFTIFINNLMMFDYLQSSAPPGSLYPTDRTISNSFILRSGDVIEVLGYGTSLNEISIDAWK